MKSTALVFLISLVIGCRSTTLPDIPEIVESVAPGENATPASTPPDGVPACPVTEAPPAPPVEEEEEPYDGIRIRSGHIAVDGQVHTWSAAARRCRSHAGNHALIHKDEVSGTTIWKGKPKRPITWHGKTGILFEY